MVKKPPPVPRSNPSPLPLGGVEALDHDAIGALLTDARDRTLALVAPIPENDMNRVHDPLMSPLVWDLGHIAAYEDLWAVHRLGGESLLRPDLAALYGDDETHRANEPIDEANRCSLLELAENRCRWPISTPGAEDFCFCGNLSPDGQPYCAGHSRLAYRPNSRAGLARG